MQLIVDQVSALITTEAPQAGGDETASAASFLLDQFSGRKPH
jgi:hypothetical protein